MRRLAGWKPGAGAGSLLIIVCSVLGASGFALRSQLPTKNSLAQSAVIIHAGAGSDNPKRDADVFWRTAAQTARSAAVLAATAKSLKLVDSLNDLRERTTVTGDPRSSVVLLEVRAEDPRAARRLADQVASQTVFALYSSAVGNLVAQDLAARGTGVKPSVSADLRPAQQRARIARAIDEDRYAVGAPARATGTLDRATAGWTAFGALIGALVGLAGVALAAVVRHRGEQDAHHHPDA